MRDIERIDRIMGKITKIWKEVPDMRYGQLMINLGLMKDDFEMWNIEDDKWEEHIDKDVLEVLNK